MRRKRKSKVRAPVIVYYTQFKNDKGVVQPCVAVECIYGGGRVGPVWGHTTAAVTKALSLLSKCCECGRRVHKTRYVEGNRTGTGDGD